MRKQLRSTSLNRRGFLRHTAMLSGAAAMASPAWARCTEQDQPLLVGTGKADITPPLGVGILMSSGRELWEPFDEVRLPLWARAIVVQKGKRRIAIVSLDLLGLAGEAIGGLSQFKETVAAATEGAVNADDVALASTHTHCGPESIALSDLMEKDSFKTWVDQLARQIGSAIRDAAGSVRPCRMMVGSRPAAGLAVNRRIKTTRGITSVRRQVPPDELIGPEGPIDDQVRVGAFMDESKKPAAILVNFTAHPVLEMCIKHVSPDYPGEMVLELQRRHPGAEVLFLQGACGNINPPTMDRSPANAQKYAGRLAKLVDEALGDLVAVEGNELNLRWKAIKLPVRDLTGELQTKPLETRIGAARIGNAVMVFLPGEPFVEIALAIREVSPFPYTAVAGYAEDYIGYIPTDRAFENGGYEVRPGRWSRVATGSEKIVCREAIGLLRTLRDEG
ncbi:MAG: neutral/alkaline non-lysosomal ceramidase N-terminal domain-containing protein [Pirellulaceae bacterium]|nr:neutral/alkaline non-lysosomal ceramidase N-terminal domain-containing protein [Pirellulaceae bacterium]